MKIYILLFLGTLMSTGAFAQQQSPTDMQNQMNAADVPQSSANTTIYRTPLKTYQQYYAAFTGGHSSNLANCNTDAFNLKESDGRILTEQDHVTIDSKLADMGCTNFRILSFVFTANPTRPKITFLYSYSREGATIKEQIELIMVDTPAGWKIDAVESMQK